MIHQYFRMNNEFNSQEWSLPGASTMKELEKVCLLYLFWVIVIVIFMLH
jgi:hypothetical protein